MVRSLTLSISMGIFFYVYDFAHCLIVKGSHGEERNTVFEIRGPGLIHFVVFSPISDTHLHL